jgi:hypothetical protein
MKFIALAQAGAGQGWHSRGGDVNIIDVWRPTLTLGDKTAQ